MNVIESFLRHAIARPNAIALRGEKPWTYGMLANTVGKLASGLREYGMKPGDVVSLRCQTLDCICMTLAVAWNGGTSVIFSGLPPEHARSMAQLCRPSFLVESDPKAPRPGVRIVTPLQLLELAKAPVNVAQCGPEDVWRIGFSSGTTGTRKVMKFTHAAEIAKMRILSDVPEITGARTLVVLGVGLTFAIAYWLRELSRGASVEVNAVNYDAITTAIERDQVDLLVTSPGNALQLANHLGELGKKVPVKTLMLGGSTVTPAQRAYLRANLCDNLWINYGATEVGLIALLGPGLMDRHPDCSGRVVQETQVQAVGESGEVLPAGQPGLLRFRTPMMSSGYLLHAQSSEADRTAFRDGWFYSRDIGHVDAQGLVYLQARQEDMINLGGNKFDPGEPERVIGDYPGVKECAVAAALVSTPNPVAVGFIVSAAPLDEEALRKHCLERLEKWKVPTDFVQVPELPRNEAGKVLRRELVAKYDAQFGSAP